MNSRFAFIISFACALVGSSALAEGSPMVPPEAMFGQVHVFGAYHGGCDNTGVCTGLVPIPTSRSGDVTYGLRLTFMAPNQEPAIAVIFDDSIVESLSAEKAGDLHDRLLASSGSSIAFEAEAGRQLHVPSVGYRNLVDTIARAQSMPRVVAAAAPITPFPAEAFEVESDSTFFNEVFAQCPDGHMEETLQAWRLLGGQTLWRVGCGVEGLNPQSFYFVSGPQAAPPVAVELNGPNGRLTAYNSSFDGQTGLLRTTNYFGGHQIYRHEDCGVHYVFAWTLGGFALIEQSTLPTCGTGIGPLAWISTYRAPVFGLGRAPDVQR